MKDLLSRTHLRKWLCFLLLMSASSLSAQQKLPGGGAIDTVLFAPGTNLCESEPWKLVFYDEFNDTVLSDKWTTYTPGWKDGYLVSDSSVSERAYWDQLWKDENVQLRDGHLVLISKEEPWSWKGKNVRFTSGAVHAYKQNFHRGRFEIRAKLPTGFGVWPAFWTWDAYGGRNELDFLEYWWGYDLLRPKVHRKLTSGINRWKAPAPQALNDWHINYYINNVSDWHVYAAEWDSNFVRYFVDGELKATQPRYYSFDEDPALCMPVAGKPYYELEVFPDSRDNTSAGGILVINNAVNVEGEPFAFRSIFNAGSKAFYKEFIVDYVRVYQRNIQDWLEDQCKIRVTGPQRIADKGDTATYFLKGAESTDVQWTFSDNFRLVVQQNGSITLKAADTGRGWVKATSKLIPPGCPEDVSKIEVTVGALPK